MVRFTEYAKKWTGCDNAEIICKRNNDTWCLVVCTYIDDDKNCHCWLLRMWDNPFSNNPTLIVDYHGKTKMENVNTQLVELGKAIANMISE